MFANKDQIRGFSFVAMLLVLAPSLVTAGDVKVYDKAPSVEELQRQLSGSDGTEGRRPLRTRSIVFGDSAPEQANTTQASIAAPKQPNKPQQQPAKQQTMQVGENAIAFPINFRVNSSEILAESIPFLESIASLMQKDSGIRLMVEGHTDILGNPARNNTLSRERAYSVVNYLIDRYHIEPIRLMPVGKGFSEPLDGMEATNPKNRRVQFRIVG